MSSPLPGPPLGIVVQSDAILRGALTRVIEAVAHIRDGSDEEAVHDLRVACRRLEAALDVWRASLRPRARRRLRRALRRLRRRATRARELEVTLEALEGRRAQADATLGPALDRLIPRLALLARRARARLARRVGRALARRLAGGLERALGAVPVDRGAAAALAAAHRIDARAARARDRLRQAVPGTDDRRWHAARIAVKRWRYALEALEPVAATARDRDVLRAGLRAVQGTLGELHDHSTLRDRLLATSARWERRGQSTEALALTTLADRIAGERLALFARARERMESLAAGQ